jgi:hypothetical protein
MLAVLCGVSSSSVDSSSTRSNDGSYDNKSKFVAVLLLIIETIVVA